MATLVETPYGRIDIDAKETTGVSEGMAIFEPAIKATLVAGGNPVIVLGIREETLLIVKDNGKLVWAQIEDVQLDWNYNYAKEQWVDGSGTTLEGTEGV